MIDQEIVDTLQHASVEDRILIIEALLQSLKQDIRVKQSSTTPFRVQTFDLDGTVQMDRDDIYAERVL
ncbi:MAG: hypothetical protein HQM13_18955 [SAR324 cluster bacterium]|nr:hypothetical protein [SAR324 cluster bacterium]